VEFSAQLARFSKNSLKIDRLSAFFLTHLLNLCSICAVIFTWGLYILDSHSRYFAF